MTDAPSPQVRPLDAARNAAQEIADQVQRTSDLAAVRTAFRALRDVADDHPHIDGLMRVAVCGATRFLAIGRREGDIRIIRDAHLFLATLSLRDEDDPLPHRALAEASVDLMLAEARQSGFLRALDTYRTVVAISLARGDDPNVASAHAKGAANLVALALEADAPLEADHALADLARLEAATRIRPSIWGWSSATSRSARNAVRTAARSLVR
jgi:type III secretion system FlhB-like substrate exporter